MQDYILNIVSPKIFHKCKSINCTLPKWEAISPLKKNNKARHDSQL